MKLTLTQRDIEAAIKAYVNSLLTMNSGTDMEIAFTATRGTDGLIAEIDINYMGLTSLNTEAPAPVPQPAPNRGAPAAPRASRKASESSMTEADEASTETQEAEMEDKEPDPETPAPASSKSSGRSLFSDFLPG